MRIVIEYNSDNAKDREAFIRALDAHKWADAVAEFDNMLLRRQVGMDVCDPLKKQIDDIRDDLYTAFAEEGIDLEDQ